MKKWYLTANMFCPQNMIVNYNCINEYFHGVHTVKKNTKFNYILVC